MGDNELHVIETIGNGSGRYDPSEIRVEDIRIRVTRTTDGSEGTAKRTRTLHGDDIEEYVGIGPPENKDASYDVVVIISGSPAPEFVRNAPQDQVTISVDVAIGDDSEKWVTSCPGCDRDLTETFEDGQCQACGFTFLHSRPDSHD